MSTSLKSLLGPFPQQTGKTRAVGIVGIERKIEQKRKETEQNISEVRTRGNSVTLHLPKM